MTPARPWLRATLLAGLLLGGELSARLSELLAVLGGSGTPVVEGLGPLLPRLIFEAAWMLGLAAGTLLLACRAWAALEAPATARLARALGGPTRAGRLAPWLLAWAFPCAWISLHQALLPASRCGSSWLATGLAAFDGRRPVRPADLLPALLATGLCAWAAAWSLRHDAGLRRRAAAWGCGLAAVLAGFELAGAPGTPRPFTRPGNVVLLGIDSLQANRLADPPGGRTPAPRLAAELQACFRFDSAWTPLARTYPSWVSILSGRWPGRSGVRFNLAPEGTLAPDVRWLGDALREAGYATLHATDEVRFSVIQEGHGFDGLLRPRPGAADFVLASLLDLSPANLLRQTALGHAAFAPLRDNRASPAYSPRLFVRDVLDAVDAAPRDRPLFLALHLCGDHWPFSAPAPWAWRGADPVEGCLAMVDDQAGALLDAFRASGLLERSLLVLLSDHGDGWRGPGDRTNSHGDDFRSPWANRVVLGLRGPGLPAGASGALVRTIDIHPTLLDLLGLPCPPGSVDGRSLRPLIEGRPDAPRELFAETEVDRRAWSVDELVRQHARHYAIDPDSGLVHLRPEGAEELLLRREYMLLQDGLRLRVVPAAGRFELDAFDPLAGAGLGPASAVGAGARGELLESLARHFGLDAPALAAAAHARGFLGEPLARAR